MRHYIVSYDLKNASTDDYDAVDAVLRRYNQSERLMRSTWGVVTSEDAATILARVKGVAGLNAKILVQEAGDDHAELNLHVKNMLLRVARLISSLASSPVNRPR